MRLVRPLRRAIPALLAALLAFAAVWAGRERQGLTRWIKGSGDAKPVEGTRWEASRTKLPGILRDDLGDGFPDGVRLDRPEDRENFARWIAFLAEAQYYHPSPTATEEIEDCTALIRFAFRNSLVAHTPSWRRSLRLPYEPGFGDVTKFSYPDWPLRRGLFRTRSGPLELSDLDDAAFAEFSDAETLLHYNTFLVSRDVHAARRGDLLFYYQPAQRQPYHSMLFVGRSFYQPDGSDWIVYHTGDRDGRRGEIRAVRAHWLSQHPDARWRPLVENPHFLGVYRFELLR